METRTKGPSILKGTKHVSRLNFKVSMFGETTNLAVLLPSIGLLMMDMNLKHMPGFEYVLDSSLGASASNTCLFSNSI